MKKPSGKYSDAYSFGQEESDFLDMMADLFSDLPDGAFMSIMDEFKEQLEPTYENNHSESETS